MGSQKPTLIPGIIGTPPLVQKHTGILGFVVSLNFELLISGIFPIVIGNIQLQHISVIGFKNLPVHFPSSAFAFIPFNSIIAVNIDKYLLL